MQRDTNWHSYGDLLPTQNSKGSFFLENSIYMSGVHFKPGALILAMLK